MCSHAINTYLVSKYAPNNALYPTNLITRAKIDQRLHFDSSVIFPAIKSFVNSVIYGDKTEYQPESLQAAHNAYQLVEAFLASGQFLVGDQLTLADVSCVADLNTLAPLVPIDATKYPRLSEWMNRVAAAIPGYAKINDGSELLLLGRMKDCLALNQAKATKKAE